MSNLNLYTEYTREDWQQFQYDGPEIAPVHQLAELVSLHDRLSQRDVREIYAPLIHYIDISIRHTQKFQQAKKKFFNQPDIPTTPQMKVPFVIGISGSVAVGKSTTARVLHQMLTESFPNRKVDLMTTDGFLYPNRILEQEGLMKRKGFPESYDMSALLGFMRKIKTSTEPVEHPVYSHDIYDIVPGETRTIDHPDILIVEGINVFQLPQNQQIYVSDFFDLSLYVDADSRNIRRWFRERFEMHMDLAEDDPTNYYHKMSRLPREEAHEYADDVWYSINLPNLVHYIEPTKSRADIILHKADNHVIDKIYVRKY